MIVTEMVDGLSHSRVEKLAPSLQAPRHGTSGHKSWLTRNLQKEFVLMLGVSCWSLVSGRKCHDSPPVEA